MNPMRYHVRKCMIVLAGVSQLLPPVLILRQSRLPFEIKLLFASLIAVFILPVWYAFFQAYRRVTLAQAKAAATDIENPILFQFSLWLLFALVTISAVSFGIACLPLPWPVKLGALWTWVVCIAGVALHNYNPKPIQY